MSLKLKAIGLSIVAMTALSAFAMNAWAETGGHFTSDSPTGSTIITGTESGTHTTQLTVPGLTGIICTEAHYDATITGETATEITVTPTYNHCHTVGQTTEFAVHMNGCDYKFTIGKNSQKDNTVDLACPEGKQVEITHPNCLIKVPPQNGILGVAYTTTVENGKHAITLDVTLRGFTSNFESGACVLLGTKKENELTGSVTVQGFEDVEGVEGAQVNITATGSEG